MTLKDRNAKFGDPQEALRRKAVQLVLAGQSQSDAARMVGVTRQAVSKWMKAYRQNGSESLVTKKAGRPKRQEQPA